MGEDETLSAVYRGAPNVDAKLAQGARLPIRPMLDPDLLVPRLQEGTKIGAIKELVDRLHAKGVVEDSLGFLQAVLEREDITSTLLHDVPLPHARSRTVTRIGVALGIAPEPIDFPSGDERRSIQLLCLIAVPVHAADAYLALLADLAHTFSDARLKDALLQADSSEELCRVLSSHHLLLPNAIV